LRHYLSAGLTLREVFRQQAKKGPLLVRPVAERVSQELNKGEDLESALKSEQQAFPPLFLALASVGEESGSLPEVFTELEKYYSLQQQLRRQFLTQITWPIISFSFAIVTIAVLILVMGIIGEMRPGSKPFDPLGLGLLGPSGAITFLAIVFLFFAVVAAVYFGARHLMRQKGVVDEFLLRLWVIGPCLRALALARFCLSLRLTLETGMPITKAVDLSLRATDNDAFVARSQMVRDSLRAGDELSEALAKTRLFPEDFQNILSTAEVAGRMTEVLENQTEYYSDQSRRRLVVLTHVLGWGIWLCVAVLMILAIFRIFFTYIGLLDSASQGL
jgi:type IV pilus assembly protein PilC